MNANQSDLFLDTAEGTRISLDEYINELIKLRLANPGSGQWAVQKYLAGARRHVTKPEVAFMSTRMVGKDRCIALPSFYQEGYDEQRSAVRIQCVRI